MLFPVAFWSLDVVCEVVLLVAPFWPDPAVDGVSCAMAKAAHSVIAALNSIAFLMRVSPVQLISCQRI
jgi:hypothetical protein